MEIEQGRYASGKDYLERCLALKRQLGDRAGVSGALSNLAIIAFDQGDDEVTRRYLEEALAIRRQMGDTFYVSVFLNNLGTLCLRTGEYERAGALLTESLTLLDPTALNTRTVPLHNLGDLALLQGDYVRAKATLLEVSSLKRTTGLVGFLAHTLFSLSTVARRTGEIAEAESWCLEGLENIRQTGLYQRLSAGLVHAAATACMKGDWQRAGRLLGAAEGLLASMGRVLEAVAIQERRHVEEALAAYPDPAVTVVRAEGKEMGREEALAYALSDSV